MCLLFQDIVESLSICSRSPSDMSRSEQPYTVGQEDSKLEDQADDVQYAPEDVKFVLGNYLRLDSAKVFNCHLLRGEMHLMPAGKRRHRPNPCKWRTDLCQLHARGASTSHSKEGGAQRQGEWRRWCRWLSLDNRFHGHIGAIDSSAAFCFTKDYKGDWEGIAKRR